MYLFHLRFDDSLQSSMCPDVGCDGNGTKRYRLLATMYDTADCNFTGVVIHCDSTQSSGKRVRPPRLRSGQHIGRSNDQFSNFTESSVLVHRQFAYGAVRLILTEVLLLHDQTLGLFHDFPVL